MSYSSQSGSILILPSAIPSVAESVERAKADILAADRHLEFQKLLLDQFKDCCTFPGRAVLLWDGCVRRSEKYVWPDGFKYRFKQRGHNGLWNAMRNGPPRTAFIMAGGLYRSGWELDHVYDRESLKTRNLPEGRHFTQSAGLICMTRELHLYRDTYLLWLLRGLPFLLFRYDPLGAFSGEQPNEYGFVDSRTCDVFWP